MTVPFEYVIWDADDCANYLKESKEYFLRSTRHQAGFPQSLNGNGKRPKWRALSVTTWALQKEAA